MKSSSSSPSPPDSKREGLTNLESLVGEENVVFAGFPRLNKLGLSRGGAEPALPVLSAAEGFLPLRRGPPGSMCNDV